MLAVDWTALRVIKALLANASIYIGIIIGILLSLLIFKVDSTVLGAVGSLLAGVGTVVTAILAGLAFNNWKKEPAHKRKVETLENLFSLLNEIEQALKNIQNSFSYESEYVNYLRKWSVTDPEQIVKLREPALYLKRLNEYKTTFSELFNSTDMVELYFEATGALVIKTSELKKALNEIKENINVYFYNTYTSSVSEHQQDSADYIKHKEVIRKLQACFNSFRWINSKEPSQEINWTKPECLIKDLKKLIQDELN